MERELVYKDAILEFTPKSEISALCKGIVVSIPINEITHVSKKGNDSIIHTLTGEFRTYHSMQDIFNQLPVNCFQKISRTQVVCLYYINKVTKWKVIFGDAWFPVEKYFRSELKDKLKSIIDRQLCFFESEDEKTSNTAVQDIGLYQITPEDEASRFNIPSCHHILYRPL